MSDALALLPSGTGQAAPEIISIFPCTPHFAAAEEMLKRLHAIKFEAEWCIEAFGDDHRLTHDGESTLAYAIGVPPEYRKEFRYLVRSARRRKGVWTIAA